MSLVSFFPVLTTADLPRLLAFYADGLGAVEHYRFPPERDQDGDIPDYVGLHLAGQSLGVGRAPTVPTGEARISIWCYVDDCDAVVARLAALGGTVVAPPADQPWGERVGRVLDPDGNELIIGAADTAEDET